jgi:hypothetical protein
MDVREIIRDDVNWINMAQDMEHWRAFVSTVMNFWVPINCLEILEYLSYWWLLHRDSAQWS